MDKASVRLFLLCGVVTFLCLRGAVRAWITAVHTKAMGFDWSLSHVGENPKMEADAAELGRARRFLLGIPEEGTLATLDARFDAEEKGEKAVFGAADGRIAALVAQNAAVHRRLLHAVPHIDMDRGNDGGSRGPRLLTAAA
ncbi:hypothetical protein CBR_g11102 [Chara braunii]|uniref:Uncharacterized protein n=1 Tax=Chara braunii TaxID=69332 RepID=A0A388KQ44_CHABU|nr:hypothetical protein CBR_g11102 [Chara braunii]|eukprot:GBG72169.1 hypothetical protein CBR_g11102 [Chara braunii]